MKKFFFCLFFLFLLLLSSCVTINSSVDEQKGDYNFNSSVSDSVQYEALFSEYNKYNGRVAVGISGPYVNKENAIVAATLNCVQMLSFCRGLVMQTDMSTMIGVTSTSENYFESFTIAGTSDGIFQKTAEDMEIVEVIWFGGNIGAAVFATLPEMRAINWNSSWENPESSDPTIILSCDTSYGRYAKYKNAIEASVFRAAMKLCQLDQHNVNVNNTIIDTTANSFQNQSYSISGNKMKGFSIVSFRYDEDSGKVYAIAVAEK